MNLIQAKSKLAHYKCIAVKFYEEIHDLNIGDIANGDIANGDIANGETTLNGIERSQINALEMAMDKGNNNESFGTQLHVSVAIDEPNLPHPSVNSLGHTSISLGQIGTSRTSKKHKSGTIDEAK